MYQIKSYYGVNMSSKFKFFSASKIDALKNEFINFISQKKTTGVLNADFLISNDLMFAEYLQEALISNKNIGISSNLKIFSSNKFVDFIYNQFVPNFEDSYSFSLAALRWQIFIFLQDTSPDNLNSKLGENSRYLLPLLNYDKKPLALSEQIAQIYYEYQNYRQDWLEAWQAGNYIYKNSKGEEFNLADDDRWQGILWNYLCQKIAIENPCAQPRYRIHQEFKANIKNKITEILRAKIIPSRIIVAGINSLAPYMLEVFLALSDYIEVVFLYFNPSNYYWLDAKTHKQLLYEDLGEQLIQIDYGNPLLLDLAQQGLDFLKMCEKKSIDISAHNFFEEVNLSTKKTSLLAKLQEDIFEFRTQAEALADNNQTQIESIKKAVALGTDNSLTFNICHTPMRELEVLRDQILDFFAQEQREDKQLDKESTSASDFLQPKDILVLVADIKTYAPLIEKVFALEKTSLPFYINDLFITDKKPLVKNLIQLLYAFELGRFSSYELMELLNFAPLAQRFELDDESLENLKKYLHQSNVRWGLNAESKERLGLKATKKNTWSYGLKRMLLGFASYQSWQGVIPLSSSFGKNALGVGGLTKFIETLIHYEELFAQERDYHSWFKLMKEFLADFYLVQHHKDFYALDFIDEKLQDWHKACETGGLALKALTFKDFLLSFKPLLQEAKARQHYFGNQIHFCEFISGRCIGYKKIFVLGLEEGKFPHLKSDYSSLFELFYKNPRLGDRSRHLDDKFAFLQTLLLADENLTLSWIGKSATDNSDLAPSALISSLISWLSALFGEELLAQITKIHKLQGFDRSYFEIDAAINSYARDYFSIYEQQELYKNTQANRNKLPQNFIFKSANRINLANINRFLSSPISCFYTDYLQVNKLDYKKIRLKEEETFEFSHLDTWHFNNLILTSFDDFYAKFSEKTQKSTGAYSDKQEEREAEQLYLQERVYFIKEQIEQELKNIFAQGFLFKTPIASKQFLQDNLTSLTNSFISYCRFKEKNYQLIFAAREYKLDFNGVELVAKLPPIYLKGKELMAVFVTDIDFLKKKHSLLNYLLRHLFLCLALNKIPQFNSLDIDASLTKTLVIGSGKNVNFPYVQPASATDILQNILAKYPQPLATTGKSALTYLSFIYSEKNPNFAIEKKDEQKRKIALDEARKEYEGGYNFGGELDYLDFIDAHYQDFESLLKGGFETATKELYLEIFALIHQALIIKN